MSDTASNLAAKARADFLSNNRDILACLTQSPDEVLKIVMAAAELDRQCRDEVLLYIADLDQTHPYARQVARDSFKNLMYEITSRFFCKALSDGIISPAMDFTPEADDQLRELSFVIGEAKRPAPPPPPKSAAEQLDDQIRDDWAHLPADKIRIKENDPKYKKRLNELLESDAIKSQATSKYDIGEVGG